MKVTYQVGEHRLHVRQWGAHGRRPAVVLVHGFVVSSRYFERLGPALAALGHLVFAPDLPGHGSSSKPRHCLDTQELGRVVAQLLTECDLDRVVVVGHSYGGPIAIEAVLAAPTESIESLILLDPTTAPHRQNPGNLLVRFVTSAWREPLWSQVVALLDAFQFGPRRFVMEAIHMCRYRVADRLPLITVPVHLGRGEHDKVAPARWLEDLSTSVTAGEVTTFADSAHQPHASHPSRVAAYISSCTKESDT